MTPRVGFIGLGNLGEPMAMQVAKAGFDLTVFDIRPDPIARLVALGAKEADSIDALAMRCDVILVAVVDDKQVSDVLLGGSGSTGVLRIAKPGSTVVLHSTVHPDTCRALNSTAAARRIDLLDAPVSGGPRGAQTGSLSIMVGGSASALNRCRAVLLAMGDHVTHLGDLGAGQIAKVANNVALAITMRAVHEALAFAESNGVNPETMRQLLTWGAANSWVAENWSDNRELRRELPGRRRAGPGQPDVQRPFICPVHRPRPPACPARHRGDRAASGRPVPIGRDLRDNTAAGTEL